MILHTKYGIKVIGREDIGIIDMGFIGPYIKDWVEPTFRMRLTIMNWMTFVEF